MLYTAMYYTWSVYNKWGISTTTAKYIKRYDDCGDDDMPKSNQLISFPRSYTLFLDGLTGREQENVP